jgi:hypothetical protein
LRAAVLTIALLFTGMLAVLTAIDIAHHGLTPISVLAVLIVVIFLTGIVGALRYPPKR